MTYKIKGKYKSSKLNSSQYLELAKKTKESATQYKASLIKETRVQIALEAKKIKNKAKEQGLKQGLKKAESLLQKNNLEFENFKKNLFKKIQKESLTLAISLAKKIIGEELETNTKSLTNFIKAGIAKIKLKNNDKILLNPAHYKEIKKEIDIVESDKKIEKGKAKITTHSGTINIDWENSFEDLKNNLYQQLEEKLIQNA